MPEKSKSYEGVKFKPNIMKKASAMMKQALKDKDLSSTNLEVALASGERWTHDSEEDFFADYIKEFESAYYRHSYDFGVGIIVIESDGFKSHVTVKMPTRTDVEQIFNFLESNVDKCRLPEPPHNSPPKLKIFIGHGRNIQWKILKDHLHEKHQLAIEAYEIGAQAGLTVKEVLSAKLASSSFALLVFTGEDRDARGGMHARENVIHELGLFQGHLGWQKAIVLLEEGVKEFSNILGVTQIRFTKGHIEGTFGEILATLKREFP
jgi:predicted nucleotide-binding protein